MVAGLVAAACRMGKGETRIEEDGAAGYGLWWVVLLKFDISQGVFCKVLVDSSLSISASRCRSNGTNVTKAGALSSPTVVLIGVDI